MNEMPPDTNGEKTRVQPVIGDVIRFNTDDKPSSDNYEFLVIDVNSDDATIEAMRLPGNGSVIYGIAGTEPMEYVEEILYTMEFDDVVKCVARSFMADPTQESIPVELTTTFEAILKKKFDGTTH